MDVLAYDYLTERSLRGLKAYKYKAGGYTWLDALHNPAWNWVVGNLFPMWLAPNLVTLTGTLVLLASHVLLVILAPHMDGENAPWWAHLCGFFAILIYVNLDCMDGKQARRTNTSNSLGQLFDHGCDALAVGLILINVATSAGLSCGIVLTGMLFASMVTWILAQWEEYHTGIMQYGNGYFGVLEANYSLAIAQLISALFGVSVWQQPLAALLRVDAPLTCSPGASCQVVGSPAAALHAAANAVLSASFMTVICAAAALCMGLQVAGQLWSVFTAQPGPAAMDAEERGHKELGPLNAFKHLLMLIVFFGLSFLLLTAPGEGLFLCRALLSYVCLAYAIVATQLIISHMAKEPWQPFYGAYAGLALGAANCHAQIVDPALFMYALIAALIAFYLHYVVNVVNQVCRHFGIRCLVIKPASD